MPVRKSLFWPSQHQKTMYRYVLHSSQYSISVLLWQTPNKQTPAHKAPAPHRWAHAKKAAKQPQRVFRRTIAQHANKQRSLLLWHRGCGWRSFWIWVKQLDSRHGIRVGFICYAVSGTVSGDRGGRCFWRRATAAQGGHSQHKCEQQADAVFVHGLYTLMLIKTIHQIGAA